MDKVYESKEKYAEFKYKLAKEAIIPKLKRFGIKKGQKVIEVGCGFGGVITAFAKEGFKCTGTDIQGRDLELAKTFSRGKKSSVTFILDDICDSKIRERYDIIILREVIEHVKNPRKALKNINRMFKKNAVLYVSFQPIYSPFGGHQHAYNGLIKFIPYIHLLPNCIYYGLIGDKEFDDRLHITSKEMKEIKKNKMTIGYFERLVKESGFRIVSKELYITRPTFKIALGMPIIKNRIIKKGIFAELITSGCKYILVRK